MAKSPGKVRENKKTIAKILTIVGTQQEEPKETPKPSEEKKVGAQTSKSESDYSQKEKPKAPVKKSEEK